MTKKILVEFAEIIRRRVEKAGKDEELQARAMAITLAVINVAEKNNPAFDQTRFIKACGL